YSGGTISPFFDSLLVKVTAKGRTMSGACDRLSRALWEFRIRGPKTNIPFLLNVVKHPDFREGAARVKFIESHPELFEFTRRKDRATKVLNYLADVIVNGNPDVKYVDRGKQFEQPRVPDYDRYAPFPDGTKQKLETLGRDKFVTWIRDRKEILFTDTTFRDAHQSLLATRMRTLDIVKVAESFAKTHPKVFSMEVWGGATFDVALRFLHECPWERLAMIRELMPNVLLQMLFRGSNGVGYSAYPDNLIQKFIVKSAETGIDVFRIFDSMNWVEAMKVSIKTVREETNSLAQTCLCYTGDILDPNRKKFSLQYYLDLAKELEDLGAHMIAIKDMAGLLKPQAAELLISILKETVSIPIQLHTHDTSSIQAATYLSAVNAGVDVLDVALASMSGLTSQPNFNSILAMLYRHEREDRFDLASLNEFSAYWEAVREWYYPFESGLKAGTAEVFQNEIPGGQYSNLRPQARALGLEEKFTTIKENYVKVNDLLGDIVKVTPSSKVVGDLALYMTSNDLTVEDILERGSELSFPESLVSFFRGELGQPHGGFPKKLQQIVLKGEKPFTTRPNEHLEPIDFDLEFEAFQKKFDRHCHFLDFLSYALYPKVFEDFFNRFQKYGRVTPIPTPAFFYGLNTEEEVLVEIAPGKSLIIRLSYVTEANQEGVRTVVFKLNGQTRGIEVFDKSFQSKKATH
ncbi:MAG: pyruvate carboxylase subunit B, partial [Bdellovibrionales bacterium]|nr:pyruvate carboxylase subunit B [Bdellovibrionales bacterium]